MIEHEQIYKQLFGSKPSINDEVNDFKKNIINEYEQIEAYNPEYCNVTIDNISVSCSDVVLAAKIATLLTAYNLKKLTNANALNELIDNINAVGND